MKRNIFILFMAFAMMLTGCQTAAVKQQKAISTGVYAIQSSMKAGRFDLAEKYEEQLVKVVTPPKNKIQIKTFAPVPSKDFSLVEQSPNASKPYVVLPEEFKNAPVIVNNSTQFNAIVNSSPVLKNQIKKEDAQVGTFTKQINKTVDALKTESLAAKKKGWFGGIFGWVTGILGTVGILGTIALCVFFPAAIPIVMDVFKIFFGVINDIFKWIAAVLYGLIKKK